MIMSIWEKETFFAPQDVIIAGSGFVGLWSALYLKRKQPNLKVTILESGFIPSGASTRNAGFACFGSLTELVHDIQSMGVSKTLELVNLRYKGLMRIQKYFKNDIIDFDLCGGYELITAKDGMTTEKLEENIVYLNALLKEITDDKKTYGLVDGKIKKFGFAGVQHLVKNNFEGYLHSGKLLQALLQKVQSLGVQVLTGITINSFEENGVNLNLHTSQQHTFTARQLLVCTNAFTQKLLPDADIVPARGQVLLTTPISNLPWKGTFHYDEGFYYFRNLGKRVLLGGARNKDIEGEKSFAFDTTELIQNHLEVFLKEVVLPHHTDYTIEHRWSGIMAMGSNKTPIVQQVQPKVFCAVRMSGMGVALAPVVSEQVVKMMLG